MSVPTIFSYLFVKANNFKLKRCCVSHQPPRRLTFPYFYFAQFQTKQICPLTVLFWGASKNRSFIQYCLNVVIPTEVIHSTTERVEWFQSLIHTENLFHQFISALIRFGFHHVYFYLYTKIKTIILTHFHLSIYVHNPWLMSLYSILLSHLVFTKRHLTSLTCCFLTPKVSIIQGSVEFPRQMLSFPNVSE